MDKQSKAQHLSDEELLMAAGGAPATGGQGGSGGYTYRYDNNAHNRAVIKAKIGFPAIRPNGR